MPFEERVQSSGEKMNEKRQIEQLNYTIEDRTIAELLGIQNFSSKESAILELVKNAYDAKSNTLELIFQKIDGSQTLTIIDDGEGMSADDIRNKWMHVGKSDKGYYVDEEEQNRVYAGSKGIGRFALSRLGESVVLSTKSEVSAKAIWTSDWQNNWLEVSDEGCLEGTTIVINNLRDRWTEKGIANLSDYLSLVYNERYMEIKISDESNGYEVEPGWPQPKLGVNCASSIDLQYIAESHELVCKVASDEFRETVAELVEPIDIKGYSSTINIFNDFKKINHSEETIESLFSELSTLGDFSARFFFSLDGRAFRSDDNPYLYKFEHLDERITKGVVLYRNAFSISSYEGKKDWLGLSSRAGASPAAASHPTGAWRLRKNQITGYVSIDKDGNRVLNDLSNRQGLEEDFYYDLFLRILIRGISEFERYRQSIIRKIAAANKEESGETAKTALGELKADPASVKGFDYEAIKRLLAEIDAIEYAEKKAQKERIEGEERYRYDVRLLNALSTVGLKASSLAHELRNKRNFIDSVPSDIVEALNAYGFWEELNKPENTGVAYRDVPYLLSEHQVITSQLLAFLDTMLTGIQKSHFYPKKQNIYDQIRRIADIWKSQYKWVNIEVHDDSDMALKISEDTFSAIFDNLILNSIQQNDGSPSLNITIDIKPNDESVSFVYADDGRGLDAGYRVDPLRILEVHESSREDGHGLGMWIVNNTLSMMEGEVTEIPINIEGFEISFYLKEQN